MDGRLAGNNLLDKSKQSSDLNATQALLPLFGCALLLQAACCISMGFVEIDEAVRKQLAASFAQIVKALKAHNEQLALVLRFAADSCFQHCLCVS